MQTINRVLVLIATLCCSGSFCLAQDAVTVLHGKVTSVENGNTLIDYRQSDFYSRTLIIYMLICTQRCI
jgi:hypothetical protein